MERNVNRFPQLMMVVLAALLLMSAGCSSRTPPSPTTTHATAGQLSASPANVAFGTIAVNTTITQNVQLSNPGASSVTISSANISGPGFGVTGLGVPLTLASGQSMSFSVQFNPSSPGAATGSVQITAADATPPLTIALSGTAATATASSHSVALSWVPSTSTVIGYNVYRANQSGGPYAQTNSSPVAGTTFADSGVVGGQTYWYVITAVANGGVESTYSNEAMAVIPTP